MSQTFHLEVITPERSVLESEVQSIIVPAAEGSLGVLPNHAPLITGLKTGLLKYTADNKKKVIAISGGFLEVSNNKATVLADTAEKPEDIDVNRAIAAKERAEARLKERSANLDAARAEMALIKALNRINANNFHE